MVRLNGVCAFDHIKSLIDTVKNLSDNVAQLKRDNLALKNQVEGLQTAAFVFIVPAAFR
jgi:hypothetical protein